MTISERLARWRQAHNAPVEEAHREIAARRAVLDGLSLAQADRALALVLVRPAVWPPDGLARADGLDAYSAAFVEANDDVALGGEGQRWVEVRAHAWGADLLVVGLGCYDELYGARPGSPEVFVTEGSHGPESVAR